MAAFHRVAAYAPPGAVGLGLGLTGAIFRPRPGLTAFDFGICAERRGPLHTDLGVPVLVEHGPELFASADLILLLPGASFAEPPSAGVIQALRAAHERGVTLAAHCLGVFGLAATGLIDDLEVTTHWQYADQLTGQYPRVRVRPQALYLDHGNIVTGAGAAAGIDMCLHLIRRDHGAGLANSIARILVTPPHRDGGQQQFITAPLSDSGDRGHLADVIAWARANLDRQLSLDELAARALMSRRSFARHFKAATGATPHAWLLSQRLSRAEELLETTTLSIEQIAGRVGYRSAAVFREQFTARRGVPPRDYRQTFRAMVLAVPSTYRWSVSASMPDTSQNQSLCRQRSAVDRTGRVNITERPNETVLRRFRQRPLPERVPCRVAFMPHARCPSDERCYEPGRSPSGADAEDRRISPTGSCPAPSF